MRERSIIHVGGSPGSGKSRLAKAVAERLNNETDLRAEHISLGDRLRTIGRRALWSSFEEHIALHLTDPRYATQPLDNDIVEQVVAESLSHSNENGIDVVLLDGYPRYESQVETFFDLAQRNQRLSPGALIATIDNESALVRILKRGQKNADRAIGFDEALEKLDLHHITYPSTLQQLGMYASRFTIYDIDTSGPYTHTSNLGFEATLRLLGKQLPADDVT